MKSSAYLWVAILGAVLMFQGCARVEFKTIQDTQSTLDVPVDEPEFFEMASTGMVDQPDTSGSIFLSGSIGATPAMGDAEDDQHQKVLSTGFYSIHSSFLFR